MDLTPAPILLAEIVGMILDEGFNIICFVYECHLSYHLMAHRSNEDAMEVIVGLIPANFCAISEFDLLVSMTLDCARL